MFSFFVDSLDPNFQLRAVLCSKNLEDLPNSEFSGNSTENVRLGAKNKRHGAKNVRHGAEKNRHSGKNVRHGAKNVWLGAEIVEHGAKNM